MGQPADPLAFSRLLCPESVATADWNNAIDQLYGGLRRGYVIIQLTADQSTGIIGCRNAFERFFELPEEQKFAHARREDASVRGYFNLPDKEVYETALGGDCNSTERHVQPFLTAVGIVCRAEP
jgi:isopenicillin N synthase-like dioxygenase